MVNKIRDWINTGIAFAVLIIMVIGLFQVVTLNVNLEKITSGEVETKKVVFLGNEGEIMGFITGENNTLILKGNTSSLTIS